MHLNILYRVEFIWNNKTEYGVGFASSTKNNVQYEEDLDCIIFGLSLPKGGVINIKFIDAVSYKELTLK